MSSPDQQNRSSENIYRQQNPAPSYNPRNFKDLVVGTSGALGAVAGAIAAPMTVWIVFPEYFSIYSAIALAPIGLSIGGGIGFAAGYLGFKGYERFIRR